MTQGRNGPTLSSAAIRRAFGEFFEARGHLAPPPASLVPAGDPSVLFTTAGMQQFKPYYLGVDTPPAAAADHLPALLSHLRHRERRAHRAPPDLLRDARQLLDRRLLQARGDRLGARVLGPDRDRPGERVKVSVFGGDDQVPADDEAIAIWKSHGFTDDDIVHLGRGDNFWGPAGPTGPCGPCTELYYDMGEELGCGRPDCGPGCECDRWMEYWNLVFVQYEMDERRRPLAAGRAEHRHGHGARARHRRSTRASSRSTRPTRSGR